MSIDQFEARVGEEIGISDWLTVDQAMVDAFAAVSGDHQWIHVDPARAATETPFGGTIAHGFLILSLLSRFRAQAVPPFKDVEMGINYGFDRIRFTSPVVTGTDIRGRFQLESCERRDGKTIQFTWVATVEKRNDEKPALVADWLTRAVVAPSRISKT